MRENDIKFRKRRIWFLWHMWMVSLMKTRETLLDIMDNVRIRKKNLVW